MYADCVTDSMEKAITETERRRKKQMKYNDEHGIVPRTIIKKVSDIIEISTKTEEKLRNKTKMSRAEREKLIAQLTKEMKAAAKLLEFEHAAYLRDRIKELQG